MEIEDIADGITGKNEAIREIRKLIESVEERRHDVIYLYTIPHANIDILDASIRELDFVIANMIERKDRLRIEVTKLESEL